MKKEDAIIKMFGAPLKWRTGQTMFNFLEWVAQNKDVPTEQSLRMADPFYMTDKELDSYYKEYIEQL